MHPLAPASLSMVRIRRLRDWCATGAMQWLPLSTHSQGCGEGWTCRSVSAVGKSTAARLVPVQVLTASPCSRTSHFTLRRGDWHIPAFYACQRSSNTHADQVCTSMNVTECTLCRTWNMKLPAGQTIPCARDGASCQHGSTWSLQPKGAGAGCRSNRICTWSITSPCSGPWSSGLCFSSRNMLSTIGIAALACCRTPPGLQRPAVRTSGMS